jgi:hypothetical protein
VKIYVNCSLESNFRHREELHDLLLVSFAVPFCDRSQGVPMRENTNLRRTLFVVQEDDNARRSLAKDLRESGYRLLVSADLEDAFEWVSGSEYIQC